MERTFEVTIKVTIPYHEDDFVPWDEIEPDNAPTEQHRILARKKLEEFGGEGFDWKELVMNIWESVYDMVDSPFVEVTGKEVL